MANPLRGEIQAQLGDRHFTFCLTLGAIAELENNLGVASIAALLARYQGNCVRASDVLLLLVSALKGQNPLLSDDEARELLRHSKPAHLIKLAADLVEVTFGEGEPARPFGDAPNR